MPTYTYVCTGCAHEIEAQRAVSDRMRAEICPKCKSPAERAFRANYGGFILKGGGWFKKGGFRPKNTNGVKK